MEQERAAILDELALSKEELKGLHGQAGTSGDVGARGRVDRRDASTVVANLLALSGTISAEDGAVGGDDGDGDDDGVTLGQG